MKLALPAITALVLATVWQTAPADRPVPRTDPNSQTAHAELLEKAKRGRIDLYFVGDSITRRWGALDYPEFLAHWRRTFHGWHAANFGWGADTTQNILWRLQNGELDGVDPKVVVVQAGTNNVSTKPGGDAKVQDIVRGIAAIVDTCRAKAPRATIVLTAIFPRNDHPAAWQEIVRINEEISRLADGARVRFVNINDKLAAPDGTLLDGMTVDKLHLSLKGYQVWADALRPLLLEILGPPAAQDLAPPATGDPSVRTKTSAGETGYDLWLRYRPLDADRLAAARGRATVIVSEAPRSEILAAAVAELGRGLGGLLNAPVPIADRVEADGAILVGTPSGSKAIASLGWAAALERLGADGYVIRSATVSGRRATAIASSGETGALYGAFHFLRLVQTGSPLENLSISERPRIELRLLNHWDNLDGSVERGYAGRSLWWGETPPEPASRIADYARANASIGINGTVINNVNANPHVLTRRYLERAAALARTLRPYGIRVYLSANAAAPRMLEELDTADPLDPAVATWWRAKADEIYGLIPDFGGFVVKANSEGQPGPQDYGRTHADGANVLADAVAPHGGVVMWRAFVYDADVDPDRIKRAYLEFVPLDGRFRDNVFVQVKNGPLDFQPREPFHPLFGAMPRTALTAELQVTQEYLGHANHLVYLAPLWKEFLDADTFARGAGSTVAKAVDGSLDGKRRTAIAGVANTGRDVNWTGHHFGQANWYAYGRLAWNPGLDAGAIADEWIRLTWSATGEAAAAIRSLMLESRETYVRYTMPLGLHHLIGGDHYAPMPENADPRRPDWTAIYYHRADETAVGVDRTTRGTNAVGQYHAPLSERWNDPKTTPDELLLWFHRLPWTYPMKSGGSLWDGVVRAYSQGAEDARAFESRWAAVRGKVDDARHDAVAAKLRIQRDDAARWRDKCLRYFRAFSGGTLPGIPSEVGLASLMAPTLLGVALSQRESDGADPIASRIVPRHFTSITAENLLKWASVHPEPDRYVFEPADRFVAYGEARKMKIVGHVLVWHQQTPAWVFAGAAGQPPDRETMLARMRDHIRAVVGRFKGRIHGWDVVNEAFNEDGTWRRTPWFDAIGEDYVAKAFEFAHEADPDAELYYNDYNLWKPAKLEAALRLVRDLRAKGLRVDAVGEQGHWLIDSPPVDQIDRMIAAIAEAGFTPVITELDIDVLPRGADLEGMAQAGRRAEATPANNPYAAGLPPERQRALADRYAALFGLFAKHKRVLGRVTLWGVTDRGSWLNNFPARGRTNYPLLWDRDGEPKQAFDAVVAVLQR
jgi:alpha-glucuronidase